MEYAVTCMLSWKKITNLNYNIEKEVNSLFNEFLLLVTRNVYGTFHSSELYEQKKVRGSSDSDTWKMISENHAFCYYCNEHLYSFTDIPDINSFFQKHINTNYHKSCRQIGELPDSQPMFTWEEFGVTGCCHVCNMSGLNALVLDTRTDIRGLRARHKCQSEIKYNKIDLLKRLCCLTLFLQKFTYKHKKGSLVCLLCNWKLNPDDTIMSHFASDHHMHNFLKFMQFTFKFEMNDLLNGYHLELIFRWILTHDVVINSNEPPLNSSSREDCLLVSNGSNKLYRGIRNYIEFTPKLISEILSFNALDFIAENECLLCDQKDIQASHIHKPTHQKNLQDAHNFIKNSKNYTRYLENVAKRLRPFRVEIECYYEYKNYLARVYPLLNKNTTPDRNDPIISQTQQSNSILNEAIDIIEQKNYISENKTVQKNDIGKCQSTDLSSSEPTNATQSIKPFNPDKTQIERHLVSDKKKPIDLNAAGSKTKYDTSKGKKVQEEDEGSKVTPSVNSITERNEPNTPSMGSTEKLPNGAKKKKKKRNKKNSKGDNQQVSTTMAVNVNVNQKLEVDKVPQLGNSVKKLETVIKADKTDLSISLNEIDDRIRDDLKLEVDDGPDTEKPKIVEKPALNMDNNSLQMSNQVSDIGGSSAQFDAHKNKSKSGSNNSADEKDKYNKPEKVPKKKKPKEKKCQISTTVSNPSQTKTFSELPRENEHHDSGGAMKKNASKPNEIDILQREKPQNEDATSVTSEENHKKTDKNVDSKKKPVSKKGETSKKGQNENEAVLMIPDLPKNLRDNIELYNLFRKFGKIKEVVIENGQGFLVFEDPKTIQLALNSRPMKFNEFVLELVKTTRQESLNKEEKLHPIFVYYLNYPDKLMDRIMKTVAWSSSPWHRENEIRREELLCRKIIEAIKKFYPRSRCYPFGSRVTGLSLENSDLDVFLDSGDAYEGSNNLSRKINIVKLARHIWSLLKNKVAFSQFNVVTRARIPIVSFVENETNLKCDLSFSNGLSVQNTVMVKFMLSLDWRVRPLILMVKHWALLNQLLGRPFFSSYALSLMTIFYLQQISSPILPAVETLQKNFTGRRYTINGWDCNICMKMNLLPKVTNSDSVLVLLMGFFEFYEKFRYDKFIISPLTGIPLSREALTTKFTSLPMAYKRHYHNMPLHIIQNKNPDIWCVDPFDLSHNVTSKFPGKELKMFIKFCKASVEHLKNGLETEAFKVTRGCN